MNQPTVTAADRQEILPKAEALAQVGQLLGRNAKGFGNALAGIMPFERFCRIVLSLCQTDGNLLQCDRGSLILACFRIAQLGLSPDKALGQAWIIPRKIQGVWRAEFQLGYKGALQLAYRSPLVAAVRYGAVRKGDRFEFVDGKNYRLVHVPTEQGWPTGPDDLVAAWCVVDLRSGGSIPRVMYLPEILRHKAKGQGSQPAWSTDFAAMSVKTAIGDNCRRAPLETEAARIMALDAAGEEGRGQNVIGPSDPEVIEVDTTPETSKSAAFNRTFGPKAAPTDPRATIAHVEESVEVMRWFSSPQNPEMSADEYQRASSRLLALNDRLAATGVPRDLFGVWGAEHDVKVEFPLTVTMLDALEAAIKLEETKASDKLADLFDDQPRKGTKG